MKPSPFRHWINRWSHKLKLTYRTLALFIVFLFGSGLVAFNYIHSEYIINKGPNDFMTKSYVAAYLRQRYGEFDKGDRMSIRITDFKPDQPKGKKGLYTIACSYKGRHLTVQTYYDGKDLINWTDFPSNQH